MANTDWKWNTGAFAMPNVLRVHDEWTVLTLSVGTAAITNSLCQLAAESGTVDGCTSLTGGVVGQMILVKADTGDTITLKHGTSANEFIMPDGADIELVGNDRDVAAFLHDGHAWIGLQGGGEQIPSKVGALFVQTADGQVVNTTTQTTLISTGIGTTTVYMEQGDCIRWEVTGIIKGTSSPTIDFAVEVGGTEVCSTGAVTVSPTTDTYFNAMILMTCRAGGASGSVMAAGHVIIDNTIYDMTSTAATSVDLTYSVDLDLLVTWSAASANNDITAQNILIVDHDALVGGGSVTLEGVADADVGGNGNDTTLDITSGETVTISASGTWCWDANPTCGGPDGTGVAAGAGKIEPTLSNKSLLARIGTTGSWTFIGSGPTQFTAGSTGRLYLIMNDDNFADNSGSLDVTITVT